MRIPAGGLKYHWPLIGPFLQGSLLIGGESSPAQHIIRYQTPGMGRGKTFNCPDTPQPGQRCWGNYCKLFDSLIMISKYPNNEYFKNLISLMLVCHVIRMHSLEAKMMTKSWIEVRLQSSS